MIKSFIFENFKSFDKAKFEIENLTILVGTNASGKTNAIEGIKILSETASGMDLSILLDGTKSIDIRGGSQGCARFESDYFILGCILEYTPDVDLEYRLHIRVGERIFVEAESLHKREIRDIDEVEDFVFKTKPGKKDSADIKVTYNNGKKGMNPDITCIRSASILSQFSTKLPTGTAAEKTDHEMISFVLHHLRSMLFLDPQPSAMRNYIRKVDTDLRPNAENISPVLFKLFKNKNIKQKVLKFISKLPENEIREISFVETPLDEVMITLQEAYGPQGIITSKGNVPQINGKIRSFIEAKRLSDGTLRCLAIITALLSKESGSMVLIEEVDNGIHPNRAQGLISAISEIAKERGIDVVITTHNPALLNAIQREDLVGVVVCYRDSETGSSEFVQILDIEKYPELMAKGKLGDLLTKDELTKAIKIDKKDYDPNWLGV